MNGRGQGQPSRWTLANALTVFRLVVAVPGMLACAAMGAREAFVWFLLAAFFTDAIDGIVARLTGTVSRFGAMLDSEADVAAFTAIAIGMFFLYPELVHREWLASLTIVASFLAPSLAGLLRFGRFTSYHTWLVKIAVGLTAIGLLGLLFGLAVWPFRLAAAAAALAALEEIAITCLLREPRSNVRGLWRLLRERAQE